MKRVGFLRVQLRPVRVVCHKCLVDQGVWLGYTPKAHDCVAR